MQMKIPDASVDSVLVDTAAGQPVATTRSDTSFPRFGRPGRTVR